MAYNNNYSNYNNNNYYNTTNPPSNPPSNPNMSERYNSFNDYNNYNNYNGQNYNGQGSSNTPNMGYNYNNSTGSLGGVTAIGTPRSNPTGDAGEIDSIDSRYGDYRQDREVTNGGTTNAMASNHYGQQRGSLDDGDSNSGSTFSKRDSTTALTSTQNQQLVGQNTNYVGDMRNQHYNDYNQSGGFYHQYNQPHRQGDPYYDEETTRHNTLTSRDQNAYNFENDYTDRDFPGGGKGARQSMAGEHLEMPKKRRKRCCCCSWPICVLITLVILAGLGVTAFFVLPRVPSVTIKDAIPASKPNINKNPPFIDMNFTMVVEIDNNKNYVAYKFNKIDVSVFDRAVQSDTPVATGTKLDYTLLPKQINEVDFPLNVNYKAQSVSDPIIQDFINSCSPEVKNRTKLKLKVNVILSIWGIDWIYKPTISEPIPDIDCPVGV